MDGAKLVTDTIDYSKEYVVDRCFVRAKVSSQEDMNQTKIQILAVVGS